PIKDVDKEKVKKFITLYDVSNPNPVQETRGIAFIQQFARFQSDFPALLDSAKQYFPDNTPALIRKNFEPLVDICFYKHDYKGLLSYVSIIHPQYVIDSMLVHKDYENKDAWTAYRIGEAFYQINNIKGAEAFYKKAVTLAPYVLDFQNKLGASLVMLNRDDEAGKVYDFILTQDPEFVSALTNKGYLALRKGNVDVAKEYYDKALALSPDDKQALLNIAGWYIYEKQTGKAKESLQLILKKYPDEEQAKTLLQQISKHI
ncbi:MAG TPA: tetratricopeptide repeat protein, partial [Bacteroidia bacterium]|nr:tetratricopeptide repeat protein [Bacteroidia bacterium]